MVKRRRRRRAKPSAPEATDPRIRAILRGQGDERHPCPECPFRRRSMPGYIGSHKHSVEILQIVHFDGKFPCHLLTSAVQRLQGCGFDEACDLAPHCAGSLAYRRNACKRGYDPAVQAEMEQIGRRDDVFANPMEFMAHHNPGDPRPI